MNSESITIFADGSSRGNPGRGGWGAVLAVSGQLLPAGWQGRAFGEETASHAREPLDGKKKEKKDSIYIQELGGVEENTTNNRMEITAVIEALKVLQSKVSSLKASIIIYTDSNYLINGITKWVFGWQKNGWQTKDKKEVLNRDLWEKLFELTQEKDIEWKYVGGHIGISGNERTDYIATVFSDQKVLDLFEGDFKDYPLQSLFDISEDLEKSAVKKSSSSRSKAKAYSYLSQVGGEIEIHKNWTDCEKRVKGKSGVKFKKALNAEEEKEIIEEWSK